MGGSRIIFFIRLRTKKNYSRNLFFQSKKNPPTGGFFCFEKKVFNYFLFTYLLPPTLFTGMRLRKNKKTQKIKIQTFGTKVGFFFLIFLFSLQLRTGGSSSETILGNLKKIIFIMGASLP